MLSMNGVAYIQAARIVADSTPIGNSRDINKSKALVRALEPAHAKNDMA